MRRILSTKKLSLAQRELLIQANFGLVDYDAIDINSIDFSCPKNIKNAVLASKNAVRSIIEKQIKIDNCFCVGIKTAALLKEHGYHVVHVSENAKSLAAHIITYHKDDAFTFFCGNIRRDELPNTLNENSVEFNEIVVYETNLKPEIINGDFDGILFFSPSAIRSFNQKNNINTSVAFCIGNTTAGEATKHTDNVVIANKPTIENTIVQVVKHFASLSQ